MCDWLGICVGNWDGVKLSEEVGSVVGEMEGPYVGS